VAVIMAIMAATTGIMVITAITGRTITTDITTTAAIITTTAASASGFMVGHFTGALTMPGVTITSRITTAAAIESERTGGQFWREKNAPVSREFIVRDSRWRFVVLADVGSTSQVQFAP
jgi:hypothetical protein